jgi:hypothetical protein
MGKIHYLLDFLIAIHSQVFVLDLAGDIDFEKPKSSRKGFVYRFTHLSKSNNKGSSLKTKGKIYIFNPWDYE